MIPILAGLALGAAMGGGIAALQKKDILQGALMGGIGGALGGAFMPAVAGAGAGATQGVLTEGATSALTNAASQSVGALPTLGTEFGVQGAMAGTGAAGSGGIGAFLGANKYALAGGVAGGMMAPGQEPEPADQGNIYTTEFSQDRNPNFGAPGESYFTNQSYAPGTITPVKDYKPTQFAANGGIIALAEGGNPQDYSAVRPVNPAVQEYNRKIMERANQQYNINARPASMQVPGSAGYGASNPLPVTANSSNDAGIGGFKYDPITRRYTGDGGLAEKEKSEIEKMREEMDQMRLGSGNYDPGNSGGGEKNGGRITQRYNMGGDIGMRYTSPDDMGVGDRIGAHAAVNMGPQFPTQGASQKYAEGGLSSLGSYSDGGQLLKGPGDGVSDSIPAQIGAKQPARLADGEFVVPARIVSELGNGSTDAGAKQLYAMMDRVQKNRKKSVGKGKVAVDAKSRKLLPA